jgi:hypothetical protein
MGHPLLNALETKGGLAQGMADCGDVGCAAGFEGDVDYGLSQADSIIGAVVDGFYDVGSLAGEDLGQGVESAGTVLEIDAKAE